MLHTLRLLLVVVLLGLAGLFGALNPQTVVLSFGWLQLRLPLGVSLLLAAALGATWAGLLWFGRLRRLERELRTLKDS